MDYNQLKDLRSHKYKEGFSEYTTTYFNHNVSCSGIGNFSFIAPTKKIKEHKKFKTKSTVYYISDFDSSSCQKLITKSASITEIIEIIKDTNTTIYRLESMTSIPQRKPSPLVSKDFIVVSELDSNNDTSKYSNTNQTECKVYRCELSTNEQIYCPACTSHAMFEVLRSLYECYKKKTCDNCNCILCGPVFRERRRRADLLKKSKTFIKHVTSSIKDMKEQIKKAEKSLKGKTKAEKEKTLKDLAMTGVPLPEGKTTSEKALIKKVKTDLGVPPAPKTAAEEEKMTKLAELGMLQPLEGKTAEEKEKYLQNLADMNIPLPEGRTPSEKALIQTIKATARAPPDSIPEKLRKAKAAGILTPLEGKSPEQKKNILRGLAMAGLPLPEVKTPSQQKILDEVRFDLGLPPEPKTAAMKEKYKKAADIGLMQPLEGKSPQEKERILKRLADLGIPLPTGRTPSEKDLIAKIKPEPTLPPTSASTEKMRKAKAAGLITPLKSKTPEQKEKILKGLANLGILLPEGTTPSEKNLINKVRADLGLPPEPKTAAMKDKHIKAADAGLLQPLEGKTLKEKEKILRGLNDMGIPLPEGRTPSEKALIAKIKTESRAPSILAPSEKMRKAKVAGLLTPLKGKTPKEKENILSGLASLGIPLPEGTTDSEKNLIDKVRTNLGLPPEPNTPAMKEKHIKAADAGLLQPLEGKTPKEKERILRGLNNIGIPLPEGRTPSEKDLIAKIKGEPRAPSILISPSEKMRRAKVAGLITPLKGKSPKQKEKILTGLANLGIPLPEGTTDSEKKIINKVRSNLGLPPEPKTSAMKDKYAKAADAGLLQPLEGKSPKEKEKILTGLNDIGIPLPKGRTASEKALIAKIKAESHKPSIFTPSEKMRRAKASGLLTPLQGKPPEKKEKILRGLAMHGMPLPEGATSSEKNLINKVRADLGLPPEPKTSSMKAKYEKAADAGLLLPLEGKTSKEKEKILAGLNEIGIPLPEGRTPSEKALINKIKAVSRAPSILSPSEKMRRAKAAGLITPLKGKTPEQKEKILKSLANLGIPLPEGTTDSEKDVINKLRTNLGLPPEPKTPAMKEKYAKAADAGLLLPLQGKTPKEKERILRGLNDIGIPLPEGRTPSEKALITKIKSEPRAPSILTPSEKMRRAKVAGLITPLKGKTPEQREKVLKGLATLGIPLPEGTTDSEKNLINKLRTDLGLPPEPKTPAMKDKHAKAADAGFLQPLQGKTPQEKERILRGLNDIGIPLPEGRTPSEKALITKIKAEPHRESILVPSEKMRKAKATGLLTPLQGKSPKQKEKILKGLAMLGIPLPEGTTDSEKNLINKVRADLGLPPEPKNQAMKEKHAKAADAGLLQPLEGKTPIEKEKILRGLNEIGIPLPEGRTPTEKALISKLKGEPGTPSILAPSEKMRRAKVAGLITPLSGKTPEQREKILKGLASLGIPLPEGKTDSEKSLINKVRANLGLPPEPKTSAMRTNHAKAADAGLLQPLEGKTPMQKEKILRGLNDIGIPLPEGRTPSEKALIARIKTEKRTPSVVSSTAKMRGAKAATHLIPSAEMTPEQKKKEVHRRKLDLRTRRKMKESKGPADECICGLLSPEPKPDLLRTPSASERLRKAKAAGLITPLQGKPQLQKEKILKGLAINGILLPEGSTSSEKSLINKVRADLGLPPEPKTAEMKEKHMKAADAGLLQPLEGKTPKEKERILRGLNDLGIPLPEGRTPSEKSLVNKIKAEPRAPSIVSPSEKMRRAKAAGFLTPLKGKPPERKEKILKGLAVNGILLPEGTTASEKSLIKKVRADLGLPPEPETPEMKAKHAKAADAGLLQPLDGKTPKEKERILRGLNNLGIPLPEGRTPSEKSLVNKIKAEPRAPSIVSPSEKMRRAKAAGFLTPLKGKPLEKKEKILKGLAVNGILLPEGTTASEKSLIKKVRADLGLPPEPETAEMKAKHAKAADAGLLQPLDGKTPKEKERILRGINNLGIPLPEGRTPSEKSLVNKIKAEPRAPSIVSPSEKMRRAKAAGFLTPLKGKPLEKKEKILKGLAVNGILLPEGTTASEKSLIKKVRADLGLPPEPETPEMKAKHAKAADAGLLQPLEGKSPKEKERIIHGLADLGIPLPEGRTPSEKALIDKYKAVGRPPSLTTEKLRKAKEAGLFTPLKGKSPKDKERILRNLAKAGLPLPEGRTPSDIALIKQIKKEAGLPEEAPEEKIRKAKRSGYLTPLEGKTPEQKEKILRGRVAAGLPLPIGTTASEKDLIKTVKESTGYVTPSPSVRQKRAKAAGLITPLTGKTPSQKITALKDMIAAGVPIPPGETPSDKELIKKFTAPKKTKSQKLKDAKTAGILTPLTGKTPEQKEKILRGLVNTGLPLPEPETPSEKSLINKIIAETGLPPAPSTPSIKEKYKKAQAEGLITPLEGKLYVEKEDILRRLHEAGIPLPVGRTPSEKSMIKRIVAETKTKTKRETMTKSIGVSGEIKTIKPTVCDHACGCDKKKIKFKHSYVKITVLSPDISSLCPCPNECLPKLKTGVVTDPDGIKITIGSAVGIPTTTYSRDQTNILPNRVKNNTYDRVHSIIDRNNLSLDTIQTLYDHMLKKNKLANKIYSVSSFETCASGDGSMKNSPIRIVDFKTNYDNCITPYAYDRRAPGKYLDYPRYFQSTSDINKSPASYFSNASIRRGTSDSSLTSIFIVKSETSLSMTTSADSFYTNSLVSYTDDTASIYTQYSDPTSYGCYSDTTLEYSRSVTNDCYTEDVTESDSMPFIRKLASIRHIGEQYIKYKTQGNLICFRKPRTKLNSNIKHLKSRPCNSILVLRI